MNLTKLANSKLHKLNSTSTNMQRRAQTTECNDKRKCGFILAWTMPTFYTDDYRQSQFHNHRITHTNYTESSTCILTEYGEWHFPNSTMWMCPTQIFADFSSKFAYSALTLLVGRQEEHPTSKNWMIRCWCGYLSRARCRLFAYGPADATASQNPTISCLI